MCHLTKSIDRISTGVAKRYKRICSNDRDFLEQSKKYSAHLAERNHQPKEIVRAFKKINNQPRSKLQQKRAKSKVKPVIFTTQYNPVGRNINPIVKKPLPIIIDNPNLVEMFPKDSMFRACKHSHKKRKVDITYDYDVKGLPALRI